MESKLKSIQETEIDVGTFKYVYIRVYEDAGGDDMNEVDIVRGYNWAEYHADIYDKVDEHLGGEGLDCECLGGGRITHNREEKYIKVFGYSVGFGKANHQKTVDILKRHYGDYTIEWSDEGY